MSRGKKKAYAVEFFGENQQKATRRYYTYLLFSSISQLENGAYLIWKKN